MKDCKHLDGLCCTVVPIYCKDSTKAVRRHGKIMSLGTKNLNLLKGGKRDERKKYTYLCQNMNTRVEEGDLYFKIWNSLLISIFSYTLSQHRLHWGKCVLIFLMS